MSMTLEAAARRFTRRHADSIKRHSLWYLIEGVLLVVAGDLAMITPWFRRWPWLLCWAGY